MFVDTNRVYFKPVKLRSEWYFIFIHKAPCTYHILIRFDMINDKRAVSMQSYFESAVIY